MNKPTSVFMKTLYAHFLKEIELGQLDENIIHEVAIECWLEAIPKTENRLITEEIWDKAFIIAMEKLKLLAQLETTVE